MALVETEAKTILRRYKRIDSWFVSRYAMNLYRGCFHDCVYCDGRAETYRVEGTFGRDIEVKTNALRILDREIDPRRRRKPLTPCFMMVGGGVNDSYQPAERTYRLTRGALKLLLDYGYAALILTKSPFVREDIDLIAKLNRRNGAVLGISFSSTDPEISRTFEPTVAAPRIRLEVLREFRSRNVPVAMFLMPILPFISDDEAMLERTLGDARDAGVDYVVASGLTLKPGRQMDHFMAVLERFDERLVPRYRSIYAATNPWGGASPAYERELHRRIARAATRVGIPLRMPRRIFAPILEPRERAVVMLDHIDYYQRLSGRPTRYGRAAHALAMLPGPLAQELDGLAARPAVGPEIAAVIREIVETGSCAVYEAAVDLRSGG